MLQQMGNTIFHYFKGEGQFSKRFVRLLVMFLLPCLFQLTLQMMPMMLMHCGYVISPEKNMR